MLEFRYQSLTLKYIEIALLVLTPLRSPDIFYNMLQGARKRKSRGRTSMRASKRTLQASVLSVHYPQMKNRGTKCAFILVVVRPTVAQSSRARLNHTAIHITRDNWR